MTEEIIECANCGVSGDKYSSWHCVGVLDYCRDCYEDLLLEHEEDNEYDRWADERLANDGHANDSQCYPQQATNVI